MAIKLEDLIPQTGKFTLSVTGKTYRLNPVTVIDELWMADEFGGRLEEIFAKMQMMEICRIVFRLMFAEDKKDFKKKTVKVINEEGDEESYELGGAELLAAMIRGVNEKIAVHQALLVTIGVSRPLQKKLAAEAEAEAPAEEQKKSPKGKRAGLRSSTTSRANTGTRFKNSGR